MQSHSTRLPYIEQYQISPRNLGLPYQSVSRISTITTLASRFLQPGDLSITLHSPRFRKDLETPVLVRLEFWVAPEKTQELTPVIANESIVRPAHGMNNFLPNFLPNFLTS